MATTRFSKPWPCAGIRLGATLSLWRRMHCERLRVAPCTFLSRSRGRLRGTGVFEVCRGRAGGRAAALCRGDWVRGALCTRRANVRFAWQAAGIVRAGSVLAGRVGGAVPWVRGVSRARMILRAVTCVSRGRRGTPDACPRSGRQWRVDPRGRCGETCIWTLVRVRFTWQVWWPEVSRRWIRVAGVGKRAHSVRFAWQAWGMRCDRWPRWASFYVAGAGNRAR